jgi:hypothetical protein
MLASVAAQRARVLAEAGQAGEASRFLGETTKQIRGELLRPIGEACFQGFTVYDDLLHHFWPTLGITADRVGVWASRFDPETGSLGGVVARLQKIAATASPLERRFVMNARPPVDDSMNVPTSTSGFVALTLARFSFVPEDHRKQIEQVIKEASTSGLTHIDSRIAWTADQQEYVPAFFDLLDGAWEDIDRLEGHAAEYAEMSRRKLRVAEYGQRLRLDNVPEGVRLVVMTDDEELLEDEREAEGRLSLVAQDS